MNKDRRRNKNKSIDRRSLLRTVGAVSAGTTLGGAMIGSVQAAPSCGIPEDRYNEDEVDHEWLRESNEHYISSGSSYRYDRAIEIRSALMYTESAYVDNNWHHFFHVGSYIVTQRKESWQGNSAYDYYPNIQYHDLTVENRDPENTALFSTNSPNRAGAYPPPDDFNYANYGQAGFTVLAGAIGLTNPYLAVGITGAQATAALVDTGENESGSIHEYHWPYHYTNEPCEATHYVKFIIESLGGTAARANVEAAGVQAGHGGAANSWRVDVDVRSGGVQSSSTSNSDSEDVPQVGTTEYVDHLEQSPEIEKIPFDEIKDPDLYELADEEPVYRALNPMIHIESDGEKIPSN